MTLPRKSVPKYQALPSILEGSANGRLLSKALDCVRFLPANRASKTDWEDVAQEVTIVLAIIAAIPRWVLASVAHKTIMIGLATDYYHYRAINSWRLRRFRLMRGPRQVSLLDQ